jgi:hypothetical protein
MEPLVITPSDIELRRDFIKQGWTDRDIARQVRIGVLDKVRYGAYIRASRVGDLDEVGRMRVRARAVLRTAHPTSVLCNQSALAEYGEPLWGVDLTDIHLNRTDGKPGRREAGVVHHSAKLSDTDWAVRGEVPVVHPAFATIEVVLTNRPEVGLVAACGMLHRGHVTLEQLHEAAVRADRWPNSLHARIVLARVDGRLTNVAEARTWHLFFDQQIPRPEPQVEVHDSDGNLLGIVDFLWEGPGVFLEFDGKIKYEKFRRRGETLDEYLLREKRREEQICAATGWVCLRITWADLSRPVSTARRIHALLARRRPAA